VREEKKNKWAGRFEGQGKQKAGKQPLPYKTRVGKFSG
jgi:hypothetical protein